MRLSIFAPLLLLVASVAHSADSSYFNISELLQSDTVKALASRPVKLYWGDEKTPEFAETAPPDVYTRSSISLGPFGGSRRHCVDAFEKALTALVDDAEARGYDAIIHIRPAVDGEPSKDAQGFSCKPGYKTTEVPLSGTFAMSQAALERYLAAEKLSATQVQAPQREADGAVTVALGAVLDSPQAKSILGTTIQAYAGLDAPAYRLRYGPDDYAGEADVAAAGAQAACQQAVLNALQGMVDDAKSRSLDTIIKIRSYLNEQYAPVSTDAQCQVNKKTASVALRASLVARK